MYLKGPYWFAGRLFAVASLLFLAACDVQTTKRPLKFSGNAWVGYEPFFVAETLELYEPGSVHLIETPISITLEQALWGGTIDAVAVSLSRAFSLLKEGHDITIVLVVDWSNGADKIVAHPSIKTIADLKGKSVGAEAKTVNAFLLERALEQHNISKNDVNILPIINEQAPAAYENGTIQAASAFGKGLRNLQQLGAQSIFDSSMIPGEIIDVLVVRTEYLNKNPERVQQLIQGWLRAVDYLAALPENSDHPLGLLRTEEYKKSVAGVHFADTADNMDFLQDEAKKLRFMVAERAAKLEIASDGSTASFPKVDPTLFLSLKNKGK
jgi:NitT/TauT family transport system substrate-binding protein